MDQELWSIVPKQLVKFNRSGDNKRQVRQSHTSPEKKRYISKGNHLIRKSFEWLESVV